MVPLYANHNLIRWLDSWACVQNLHNCVCIVQVQLCLQIVIIAIRFVESNQSTFSASYPTILECSHFGGVNCNVKLSRKFSYYLILTVHM